MTISDVSVGETVKAAKQNEIIDGVNLSGIVGVVPSAVSGTGVTVDALSGTVSFSSSTTIAIDGCFSSTYRNYKIIVESTGTSSNLNANLRASGSDVTTSNYDKTEILARNATVASSTLVAQSNWNFMGVGNTLIQADMDLSGPFLAVPTTAISRAGVHSNPAVQNTSNAFIQGYLSHRLSTSYDGIKFTYSAAQSGTVRVYGYN